jgi:hypothetical protein
MSAIRERIRAVLRGPMVSRWLARAGIDARRYWLLTDLLEELSERREMFSQLGRDGIALKTVAWFYFAMSVLFGVLLAAAGPPLATYFWSFLGVTVFFLLTILVSETSNSLVNPGEALLLAHYPIDGATYTAAKLSHLLRILLYLVPGLNAVPALAGLLLPAARWYYPAAHLLAAFGAGLVTALLCCAVFGWLIRFVPPRRLKAAGQTAEIVPWAAIVLFQYKGRLFDRIRTLDWLPADPQSRRYLALAAAVAAVAVVALGIRSLSGDYLARVAAIAQGASGRKPKLRRSRLGAAVARWSGGPAARAGYEYLSRMMLRDWQFRRQLIPLLPVAVAPIALLARGLGTSPFSGRFTVLHLLPHVCGVILFWICTLLPYGADHKGAWIFLLAPARAFGPFARGVHAMLWLKLIAIPHALLLPVLAWFWGAGTAALFVTYSAAAASFYLALEIRLIEGLPFARQPETFRGALMMPLMIAGGLAMAIAVAVQYLIFFRSPSTAAPATAAIAAGAAWLTSRSLAAYEGSIRYSLGLLSNESGVIYKEIDS